AEHEPEEEGAGDVDDESAGGELPAGTALHPPSHEVAAHATEGAAEGDVPEHAGKYTFPPCSASPSRSSDPTRGNTTRTSAGSAGCSARSRGGASRPTWSWRRRRRSPA